MITLVVTYITAVNGESGENDGINMPKHVCNENICRYLKCESEHFFEE